MPSNRKSKDWTLICLIAYLFSSLALACTQVEIPAIPGEWLVSTHRLTVMEIIRPEFSYLPTYMTIMLVLLVPVVLLTCIDLHRRIDRLVLRKSRRSYATTCLTSAAVAAFALYGTLFGGTVAGGISQRSRAFTHFWYFNDVTAGLVFFMMLWFVAIMVSISWLCATLAYRAKY